MSSLSTIPKQSYFSAQLQSPIDSSQTTGIILTDSPDFTPGGITIYFNILDAGRVETISATGWTANELTGVTRAVATYSGETAVGYAHGAGVTVVLADDWKYWEAIQTAVNSKFDTAGGTITGATAFSGASTTFKIPNLTTAEKNALTPANGMLLYDTTLGEFQYYDGGAWNAVGTASVSNASTTVAGIIELATAAQRAAGTATGETGAALVPSNDALVKTSSGAGDENKLAVLDSAGKLAMGFIDATATPTASKIVIADGTGKIADGWLNIYTDVQTFTTSGTWTKPTGSKFVKVVIVGAGGGGGSGARQASGNVRSGGTGGGGGAVTEGFFTAASLGATETITVGTGGTGGAAQTSNGTAGNVGTAGGHSSFGTWIRAGGGGGGLAGPVPGNNVAGGGGGGSFGSGSGATGGAPTASSASGIAGQGPSGASTVVYQAEYGGGTGGFTPGSPTGDSSGGGSSIFGAGGGGGGGSIAAGGTAYGGGAGGTSGAYTTGGGGAGGAVGNAGTAGSANSTIQKGYGGSGGGGGGANGANGGAGGAPGGGGGGGGASTDGTNSGAGGNGADGKIIVYSW